jgi:SAM-dependent methyltransferase
MERLLPSGLIRFVKLLRARLRMVAGIQPLSREWGDRGEPLHREYLEEFLRELSGDIRGRCLEFDEDRYTSRFGGSGVSNLEILNKEAGNPKATIVADLTLPNGIPDNSFDCIICTFVLHIVFDLQKIVAELYRILAPNGVLLVAVPQTTINYPYHHELWRFTPEGLRMLLTRAFGEQSVTVRAYGNSLTAAGWLRGLIGRDFTVAERSYHDPRFAIMVCARAIKRHTG